MTLSIDECDLLEFFGKSHDSREYGTEWFDSDSVYSHCNSDGLVVTCAVFPIHKDARITLSCKKHTYLDWQATALTDIKFDLETKSLQFSTQSGDILILRLHPNISIENNCLYRAK